MNKAKCLAAFFGLLSISLHGQNSNLEQARIAEQGLNYNRWERVVPATNRFDGASFTTNYYVELQTGLNHLVGTNFAASDEEIRVTENGAAATNGQHQVFFDGQINADGAVQIVMADGKRLSSRVLGLAYFDSATGSNVLVAELKDSVGVILPTKNQVLYADCFDGVSTSLRYTYTKAGLEQDVLIDRQLPSPSEWGLDPATTQLEVLTEFIDPAQPRIVTHGAGNSADESLDFGAMQMVPGKAFFAGKESLPIRVKKQWKSLEGRTFLIEQVDYQKVQPELKDLPAPAVVPGSPTGQQTISPTKHQVNSTRVLPARRVAKKNAGKIRVASIASPAKYFVLDYAILNSSSDFAFLGDTTYRVSGPVCLTGNTVIEGGAVVKFDRGASLTFMGPVSCLTTNYRPAVFTCVDDESVGETVTGSTGNPSGYYASVALNFNASANVDLRNVRVAYAQTGIGFNSPGGTLTDIQIYGSQNGIGATNATYSLQNALFYNVLTNFSGTDSTGRVAHLTSDSANELSSGGVELFMTNSLLVAVTNLGSFTSNTVQVVADRTGVFDETGTGGRYLVSGSPYRNVGTTNIDAGLVASLRGKTTYAPTVYSGVTFTNAQEFGPCVPRDTSSALDLGYHYDPLDYAFGGVTAYGAVTFEAGTAVGWFRTSSGWQNAGYGIYLAGNQTLSFDGTPMEPAYWVRCHTVQEWDHNRGFGPGGIIGSGTSMGSAPVLNAQFTRFSMLEGPSTGGHFRDEHGYLTVNLQNCELYGGMAGGYWVSLNARNCLFFRSGLGISQGFYGTSVNLANCTFIGNQFTIERTYPFSINIVNSAFDGALVTMLDAQSANTNCTTYCDYNAFLQGATRILPTGVHDVLVTDSFSWQPGPLGGWYLPNNSPLINSGSTNANCLGLSHYTTRENQTEEANSVVDIGYHYVALDSNGTPVEEALRNSGKGLATGKGRTKVGGLANVGMMLTSVNTGSPCVAVPSGAIAWWKGEGNATDTLGANAGQWLGTENYLAGAVGQAFSISSSRSVRVPASSSLNVGTGSGLTIEFWINPADILSQHPLVEWNNGSTFGTHMWIYPDGGNLFANLVGIDGVYHQLTNTANLLASGEFQHVAVTYDKTSGNMVLYWNGTAGASRNVGSFTPQTSYDLYLGLRPGSSYGGPGYFGGAMDEVTLYNHALTPAEIQAIYNAGASGKCAGQVPPPPTIDPMSLARWHFDQYTNWWRGDGDATDSAGGMNGTLNEVVGYASGQSGQAFSFSGAGDVSFGPNPGNFGTNDFTVDFWIKTTGQSAMGILDKRPVCNWANMWDIRMAANGRLVVSLCQDSSMTYMFWSYIPTPINDGTLHHVVLSRQGMGLSAYVDSVLSTNLTLPGIINFSNTTPFRAGTSACKGSDGTQYFSGLLDDIKLICDQPYVGEHGQQPLVCQNVKFVSGCVNRAVSINTNVAALLSYKEVESSGVPNIACDNGMVKFWFRPDWNSGTGPQSAGRFIELGSYGSDWWALLVNSNGTQISFITQTNGAVMTNLTANVNWGTNQWHQIALAYSSTNASLTIDDATVATGTGVRYWPRASVRAQGFRIGSDSTGLQQIRGSLDELETFNYSTGGPGQSITPPTITTGPAPQTVVEGTSVTFSVVADGHNGTLSYQWRKDETNIIGETSSSYTIPNVHAIHQGEYSVVVANQAGSVTSAGAMLTVITPPTITTQPQSQTVVVGSSVTFSVDADGHNGTLSYQWFQDGTNITGATSSSYAIPSVQAIHQGEYSVVVANQAGSVTSSNATLIVVVPPTITGQPQGQMVGLSNSVTLTVSATGNPLKYQWYFNGTAISGSTNSAFTLSNVTPSNAGIYWVAVSNSAAVAVSSNAMVGVVTLPFISSQPNSLVVTQGQDALFSVAAKTTNYSEQVTWMHPRGDSELYGNYLYNSWIMAGLGYYEQMTNDTLVNAIDIAIGCTNATRDLTFALFERDNTNGFSLADAPYLYSNTIPYWKIPKRGRLVSFNPTNIQVATYCLTNQVLVHSNKYLIAYFATPVGGEIVGGEYNYDAGANPIRHSFYGYEPTVSSVYLWNSGPSGDCYRAASFKLRGMISSDNGCAYQWKCNGSNIPGATNSAFVISNAQSSNQGNYSVTVSNAAGIVTSSSASLTVIAPPTITTGPAPQTVVAGSSVTFSVDVDRHNGTLSYQWRTAGTNITGATNSSYTIPNAQAIHQGNYSVVVGNEAGTVTSASATLTVITPPTITTQPQSQTVVVGSSVTFSVDADGHNGTLSYQWFQDGTNISGATSSSYTIVAQTNHSYWVVVSNQAGSVTSDPATVTVITLPTITTQPQSQTATAGSTVTFDVVADRHNGTLTYQWRMAEGDPNGLDEGMLVKFPFEGDFFDRSKFQSLNTVSNVSFTSGIVGSAAWFNSTSNSYIRFTDGAFAAGLTNLSIVAWVKTTNPISNPSVNKDIVSKHGSNLEGEFDLGIFAGGGGNYVRFFTINTNSTRVNFDAHLPYRINDGVWHMLAATYDSAASTMAVYLDGTLVATTNQTGRIKTTAYPIVIGGYRTLGSSPIGNFDGAIDGARVWNRPLSATEVASMYTRETTWTNITGATNSSYTIPNAQAIHQGNYSVVVGNEAGTVTSASATLTVITPPTITAHPQSQTASVGDNVTFSVIAVGSAPMSYQWQKDGSVIEGAVLPDYSIEGAQVQDQGSYSVVVTNAAGIVTSTPAVLTVSSEVPGVSPPSGLVSWWRGEGDASDTIGTNMGTLLGQVSFGSGEVDEAFYLSGDNSGVKIPASTSLDVGKGQGFTIECWINPNVLNVSIVEWNNLSDYGVRLGMYNSLFANFVSTDGGWYPISGSRTLSTGVFQHVAVTYDKASGTAVLYLNGTADTTAVLGQFSPQTTYDLYLGMRPGGDCYKGAIDEVSVYNRALNASEIQAIYDAGTNGKCLITPPSINSQPRSQSAKAGASVTFRVNAANPVSYQWMYNGIAIPGATRNTLSIPCVQASNAGAYSVMLSNEHGTTTSQQAALIVLPADQVVTYGQSVTYCAGAPTSTTYQWRTNGANIPGATGPTWVLSVPDVGMSGHCDVDLVATWMGTVITSPIVNLTVRKANLTITADNKIKLQGSVNPQLTGSIAGAVASDLITSSILTTATSSSAVGTYPITVTLNDPRSRSGNYNVFLLNGTLTVMDAAAYNSAFKVWITSPATNSILP